MRGQVDQPQFPSSSFAFREQPRQGYIAQLAIGKCIIQGGFGSNEFLASDNRGIAHALEDFGDGTDLLSTQDQLVTEFQNMQWAGAAVEFRRQRQPPSSPGPEISDILL